LRRKTMKHLIITALVLAVCGGSFAFADGEEGDRAAGFAAAGEKSKAVTPIQKILKELKGLVAREKARPEFDEKLVKDLQKLVKSFEKEAKKPIKLEDLPEKERERLKQEAKEELVAEREAEGEDRAEDWQERAKAQRTERALEGIELSEKQRGKVEPLLKDFADSAASAYKGGDYGMVKELKNDLEKRLKKVVGNKKARKIINNLNRSLGGRGRGGR
jgi:hypothetical protein